MFVWVYIKKCNVLPSMVSGMCWGSWNVFSQIKSSYYSKSSSVFFQNFFIKNIILLLIHFALLLFSFDSLCVQSMLIHLYYLSFNELGYNGPRVAFWASYYSQLEGFLLSHAKIKHPPASMAYPACVPPPLFLCSELGWGRTCTFCCSLYMLRQTKGREHPGALLTSRNRILKVHCYCLSFQTLPCSPTWFLHTQTFWSRFLSFTKMELLVFPCFWSGDLVIWTPFRRGRGEWWVDMYDHLCVGN